MFYLYFLVVTELKSVSVEMTDSSSSYPSLVNYDQSEVCSLRIYPA